MNIITKSKRPDQLTTGDYVFNPASNQWEPVRDAYWSDITQNYVVWLGPLGMSMHLYPQGSKVYCQQRFGVEE